MEEKKPKRKKTFKMKKQNKQKTKKTKRNTKSTNCKQKQLIKEESIQKYEHSKQKQNSNLQKEGHASFTTYRTLTQHKTASTSINTWNNCGGN